ncbi:DUF3905 domain-containing protein [Paenibacillus allorhizosphaerae]|uniref:DUF3905 domain-containing protein n=1 Tax=Paenibacillus allorhizosphaerae TaxID=2849866 RepID=A0ABN7TPD1_9BACL|nr:DUF3905 domain-containing protein [Paenibacillus allorhizosphaerae]CAG7649834.1 hypothetical protein PAECIP111802_04567 [Paenibacillus allorhizosphaerae]
MSEHENNNETASYDKVDTNIRYNEKNDPELDPFEINFLPEHKQGRGPREPFVNEYGVLIGDHEYESAHSPLEQWSEETDPSIMSGDQWVHPFKDVGFQTAENQELFEQNIPPQAHPFMHPDKDVAYQTYYGEGKEANEGETPPSAPNAASKKK